MLCKASETAISNQAPVEVNSHEASSVCLSRIDPAESSSAPEIDGQTH